MNQTESRIESMYWFRISDFFLIEVQFGGKSKKNSVFA
jgi:hypothetical protein